MRPWIVLFWFAALACGKGHEPPPPSSGAPNAQRESGPHAHPVHPVGGNGTGDHAMTVYLSTCAPCHGPEGHGDGAAAEKLGMKPRDYHDAKWQAAATDDDLKNIIRLGGKKVGKSELMPGHPEYDDATVDGLVQIIRGFGKQ